MSTITEFYKQSELAFAAYSTLYSGISGGAYTDALKANNGMTLTQATTFAAKWSIIAQSEDPMTGVSATVFQEVATGKRYLAIRGTQGPTDYLADYLILNGTPLHTEPAIPVAQDHRAELARKRHAHLRFHRQRPFPRRLSCRRTRRRLRLQHQPGLCTCLRGVSLGRCEQ